MREENKENIRELRKNGLSFKEIQRKTGIDYMTVCALNKINPDTGRFYESGKEYFERFAKLQGFESCSSYNNVRGILSGRIGYRGKSCKEQEDFENSMSIVPSDTLISLPHHERYLEIDKKDLKDYLIRNMKIIPERYKNVLEMRFFEGKTLEQISLEKGVTKQDVNQLEKSAINYLKCFLGLSDERPKVNRMEDGELLLIYLILKSLKDERNKKYVKRLKEAGDFVNKYYYGGENIRTYRSVEIVKRGRYKERLKKLLEKYFPEENFA